MAHRTSVSNVAPVSGHEPSGNHRSANSSRSIWMVGAFPPPVHGLAMVNAAMYEHLRNRGAEPLVLDLAPASLGRDWFNRLARIRKVAGALVRYLLEVLRGGGSTLYVGLSGGWGQCYEVLFVAIARLRTARVFLHHHSFAYLNRRKLPTRVLIRLAGTSATHIVICETQGRRLTQCYPTASRRRVVSNAAIMNSIVEKKHRTRSSVERIGFLGNISREKGIMEVLAIAERLESLGESLEIYIAGPFENATVEKAVQEAAARLFAVSYVGPRYGSEKESFWDLIDVLLFPSQYSHETAPLVVHEAMAHGIPVIAWARGCLSDIVRPDSGVLVEGDQDFVAVAVECLRKWQHDPAVFAELSNAAVRNFDEMHEAFRDSLEDLLNEISLEPQRAPLSIGDDLAQH